MLNPPEAHSPPFSTKLSAPYIYLTCIYHHVNPIMALGFFLGLVNVEQRQETRGRRGNEYKCS